MFLRAFLKNMEPYKNVFAQSRTLYHCIRLGLSTICSKGRRTITQGITFSGRQELDWSADYKLYSRSNWNEQDLFEPVIKKSLPYCDQKYIAIGVDDTKIKKTGKKIPLVGTYKDPMSPAYHVNLIHGHRIFQASLLLPLYNRFIENADNNIKIPSARGIPVCFQNVPALKKPGKLASPEDITFHKIAMKNYNLSTVFKEAATSLVNSFQQAGSHQSIIFVGDGSFCNKTVFSLNLKNVFLLTRCRKDNKLCFRDTENKMRFYSKDKFSPKDIYQDKDIQWEKSIAIMGGEKRDVRYKEIKEVFWQKGSGKKELRLIVISPYPYRTTKKGKLLYRKEAYLLTDNLDICVEKLIQMYIDRWEIEVNHRDEKTTLGIGQAQVRNLNSVLKLPTQLAAMYSILLLTCIECFGNDRESNFIPLPKWRKQTRRPSCNDLLNLLRKDIVESSELMEKYGFRYSEFSEFMTYH